MKLLRLEYDYCHISMSQFGHHSIHGYIDIYVDSHTHFSDLLLKIHNFKHRTKMKLKIPQK
jgi:hypothetical protein